MENEKFYAECAALLETNYDCKPFPYLHSGRTRWNNRVAGSGRFPGFGTIRVYGDIVHLVFRDPYISHTGTKESVLEILKNL